MENDVDLRNLACEAIESGRVPDVRPERLWGSSGDGTDCPICFQTIAAQDVGFELVFPRDTSQDPARRVCLVHARCLKAWDVARQQPRRVAPAPRNGAGDVP
jgi:hypothetical protein